MWLLVLQQIKQRRSCKCDVITAPITAVTNILDEMAAAIVQTDSQQCITLKACCIVVRNYWNQQEFPIALISS